MRRRTLTALMALIPVIPGCVFPNSWLPDSEWKTSAPPTQSTFFQQPEQQGQPGAKSPYEFVPGKPGQQAPVNPYSKPPWVFEAERKKAEAEAPIIPKEEQEEPEFYGRRDLTINASYNFGDQQATKGMFNGLCSALEKESDLEKLAVAVDIDETSEKSQQKDGVITPVDLPPYAKAKGKPDHDFLPDSDESTTLDAAITVQVPAQFYQEMEKIVKTSSDYVRSKIVGILNPTQGGYQTPEDFNEETMKKIRMVYRENRAEE